MPLVFSLGGRFSIAFHQMMSGLLAMSLALPYANSQLWNPLSSFTCGSSEKDQLAPSPEWQGPKETQ